MSNRQATSLHIFQSGLDNESLYNLYETDYLSVHQAFQIFLEEVDSTINELEQVYKQRNIPSFQRTIHRFKPVFSYIGLTELHNIFQHIEDECPKMSDLTQLKPPFSELIQSIKNSI